MDLPVFYVIPGVTVGTIAMVLYFFIKPNSFPRPCLEAPVFFRSVLQRPSGSLVQGTSGYAADVSIWNFVGCPGKASISQEGTIRLHRIDRWHPSRGLFTLHRGQPWGRWRRVWLSQDGEDSRRVCWGLDEGCVGLHFDLLDAGGRCAAGATIQGVRFGAVGHLILQLQVGGQGINLVNHLLKFLGHVLQVAQD